MRRRRAAACSDASRGLPVRAAFACRFVARSGAERPARHCCFIGTASAVYQWYLGLTVFKSWTEKMPYICVYIILGPFLCRVDFVWIDVFFPPKHIIAVLLYLTSIQQYTTLSLPASYSCDHGARHPIVLTCEWKVTAAAVAGPLSSRGWILGWFVGGGFWGEKQIWICWCIRPQRFGGFVVEQKSTPKSTPNKNPHQEIHA